MLYLVFRHSRDKIFGNLRQLAYFAEVIKKVTDDPEAPKASKETKDKMIDLLWPDVEKVFLGADCCGWTLQGWKLIY